MPSAYETLLAHALPVGTRTVISGAMSRAYAACDKYQKELPELSACIGMDVRPYLKRVIVDYCLSGIAVAAGLKATIEWNHARNCQHVRLYGERIVLTANAVDGLTQTPRMAHFRKKLTQSLNLSLFPDGSDVTEILALPQTCLAHIVHGGNGKVPDFLGIQIPSADGFSTLHVEKLEVAAAVNETPVEEIDDSVIERLLRDKKGKEGNGTI